METQQISDEVCDLLRQFFTKKEVDYKEVIKSLEAENKKLRDIVFKFKYTEDEYTRRYMHLVTYLQVKHDNGNLVTDIDEHLLGNTLNRMRFDLGKVSPKFDPKVDKIITVLSVLKIFGNSSNCNFFKDAPQEVKDEFVTFRGNRFGINYKLFYDAFFVLL